MLDSVKAAVLMIMKYLLVRCFINTLCLKKEWTKTQKLQ